MPTPAPQPTLPDLLAAPVGSLRVDDVHALQAAARGLADDLDRAGHQIDAYRTDAERMREVDALVAGMSVERLAQAVADETANENPGFAAWANLTERGQGHLVREVRRILTAFAAALLTDGAVEAFDNGYDNAFAPELDRFRAGIRAAIRAAGMEPDGQVCNAAILKARADEIVKLTSERNAEKARADKAHDELVDAHEQLNKHKVAAIAARDVLAAERACADQAEAAVREWQARAGTAVVSAESLHDELRVVMRERNEAQQVAAGVPVLTERANKAESDLAALETVIAETAHAAGISGTMTPAARVRAMASRIGSAERDARRWRYMTLPGVGDLDLYAEILCEEMCASAPGERRWEGINKGAQNDYREAAKAILTAFTARAQAHAESLECQPVAPDGGPWTLPVVVAECMGFACSGIEVPKDQARAEADALRADCDSASSRMAAVQGACDIAKAEADALRAEVAALRGLGTSAAAISAAREAYDYPAADQVVRFSTVLHAALATVPASSPAAAPTRVQRGPLTWCCEAAQYQSRCHCASAPQPEAPGLEPLPLMSTYGVPELRAITARVNVLSAIVKRGGL